jgi:hypothetical protein
MRSLNDLFRTSVLVSLLFIGCGTDNSTEPLPTGEIAGTITFLGTQKPDGDVKVQLWRSWPPSGNAFASADIDNANGTQSYKFEDLPLGTYQAITVDWIIPDDPAANRIIGVYWADSDSVGTAGTLPLPVTPKPVTLSTDNLKAENIDIKADHGLIN